MSVAIVSHNLAVTAWIEFRKQDEETIATDIPDQQIFG